MTIPLTNYAHVSRVPQSKQLPLTRGPCRPNTRAQDKRLGRQTNTLDTQVRGRDAAKGAEGGVSRNDAAARWRRTARCSESREREARTLKNI